MSQVSNCHTFSTNWFIGQVFALGYVAFPDKNVRHFSPDVRFHVQVTHLFVEHKHEPFYMYDSV